MTKQNKIMLAIVSSLAIGGGVYLWLNNRKRKKNTFSFCGIYCEWDNTDKKRTCDTGNVQISLNPKACTTEKLYDIPKGTINKGDIVKISDTDALLDGKYEVIKTITNSEGRINSIVVSTSWNVFSKITSGEQSGYMGFKNKGKVTLIKHRK
jgi:hypothetical protein